MSDVDWDLIDKVSRRFDQMLGISSAEQIQRLHDNFHLVQAAMDGRLENCFTEFVPVHHPDEAVRTTDWSKVRERLRQYSVRAIDGLVLESLLTPEFRCSPELLASGLWTMTAGEESGRVVRLKLLRLDLETSFHEAERIMRAKELVPASLAHLVAFAAEHMDELPDLVSATGTLAVGDEKAGAAGRIAVPVVRKLADGGGFELGLEHLSGLSQPVFKAGRIFLAARYPRSAKQPGVSPC